jgi:hypothetical protein
LFAVRGTAYVRMVYGACLTLNLAAEEEGIGAAVLIRALEPEQGIELMLRHRPASRLRDLARGPGGCARRSASAASCRASISAKHAAMAGTHAGQRAPIQVTHAHRIVARSASPPAVHRARQPFRECSAIMRAMRPSFMASSACLPARSARRRRRSAKKSFGVALGVAPDVRIAYRGLDCAAVSFERSRRPC